MFGFLNQFKLDMKRLKEIDKAALFSMIGIMVFGLINIYLSSRAEFGYLFVIRQSVWFIVALVALYMVIAIDYTLLKTYTPILYWGSIILLVLVLFLGTETNGAVGWFRLGPLSLQPSELAKIGTIMMLGRTLDDMEGTINEWKNFLTMAGYAILPAALIVIQPDMGMTMVLFFIVVGIFFIAGLDTKIILGGIGTLLVAVVLVWNSGLIQDYQKNRLISFTNPEADSSESGYQLRHSLISIGSGGFFGTELEGTTGTAGYSSQYVPEVHTDFIFASVGEHWGMLGAMLLLGLYAVMILRMIDIGRHSKDSFGVVIAIGMVSYFLFAIMQNIGMTIGLMPITGITLPLMSTGGSSLVTTVMSVGLVLNVGMRKKAIYF